MKNKIPIWENYYRYFSEVPKLIVDGLLAASDKDYQTRIWLKGEGPEVDSRHESSLEFDDDIQQFKRRMREGQHDSLSCEQIKAILRVQVMWNRFDKMMLSDPNVPEGYSEAELYMSIHPYWEKVRKQAEYALSLIEIKEFESNR